MSVDGTAVRDLEAEFSDIYVREGLNNNTFRTYICDFLEARSEKVGKFTIGPVSRHTIDGRVRRFSQERFRLLMVYPEILVMGTLFISTLIIEE